MPGRANATKVTKSNLEHESPGSLKYFSSAFLAAALWGFMSIPLRAIREWPSFDILNFRILISCLLIWIFIFIFRKKQWKADRTYIRTLSNANKKRLVILTAIASFLIMGNWFAYIYAVNHISVQSAAFAYMVCPLLTTLAGYLILKEKLSTLKRIGLVIALVSVIMLAQGSLTEVIWSVMIALLYALYLVVQKVIQKVDKLNLLAVQITLCSLIILPIVVSGGNALPQTGLFWWNITIIAVLFTIIPLYMSMYALNGISSSTAGILIYINPIIAFAVAIYYFHEPVSTLKLVAYAVLLVSIVLFNWEFVKGISQKKQFPTAS